MSDGIKTMHTPIARVSWPSIFKGKKNDKGETKYFMDLLFKKGENIDALRKAAFNAAVVKYGPDRAKWPQNLFSPFKDQGEKRFYFDDANVRQERPEFEPGAFMLALNTKRRPGVVDRDGKTPITDETRIYGGCWARAVCHFYVWEYRDPDSNKIVKRGIGCGLDAVQFARDDKPFGGVSVDLETAFSAVDDDGAEAGTVASDQFI